MAEELRKKAQYQPLQLKATRPTAQFYVPLTKAANAILKSIRLIELQPTSLDVDARGNATLGWSGRWKISKETIQVELQGQCPFDLLHLESWWAPWRRTQREGSTADRKSTKYMELSLKDSGTDGTSFFCHKLILDFCGRVPTNVSAPKH